MRVASRGAAIRDESGTLAGYAVITRDISERREAHEALAIRLRGAFAEDLLARADERIGLGAGEAIDHPEEVLVARFLHPFGELLGQRGGGGVAAR